MQSTWSDDDSNDNIDEEDLVGGLVVHNDGSKQESNIRDASTSEASHLAPCKEDIDSHLDTIVQHVNQNNDSDSDISDIDINDKKAFHESYKMMFAKWEEVYNENVTLMTQVSNLLDDKAKLESEVIHYKSLLTDKDNQLLAVTTELDNTKKSLKMMSSGTQKLDHILSLDKSSSDHHGLGYQHSKDSNSQGVFVKASSQTVSPPIVKLPYLQKGKTVAHSSPVHQGDRSALTNYQKLDQDNVTFADGVKSWVLRKGTLNVEGFPKLDNVLHVEDLKENLLSISQICDQNLFVNFDRNKCRVLNVDGNCILEGHQSSDHCYKLTSSIVCHKTTLNDTELWHQKLGHLNYRLLTRIVKTSAVKGVPMLKKKQPGICGSCQSGKQQRASHKAIQDKATMQVESLAGKRYAFVCVDDFSRYAWVDFDKTFASVAKLESTRLLFVIACLIGFKLFQMDVKNALNDILNEEAYVEQPKGFEDPHFPNHVFKLKNALYGLKQAPRAWYERLINFLLENGYKQEGVDRTLFIKQLNSRILVVQIYVDDIVFGSTSSYHVHEFVSQMKRKFEISMVGELTYFLGLHMEQMPADYSMVQDILTVFCDNTSAINISKNHVQHSRTKHIEIHHHFIRDLVKSKTVSLEYIDAEKQLADIFTKALDSNRFESLRKALGVYSMSKSTLSRFPRSRSDFSSLLGLFHSFSSPLKPKTALTLRSSEIP
ncbi:hypothetical protein KPL70_003341 [Citrus sinensis]|nr:hypothetical protein KPL70_003341 [Citrus sinensis]